MKNIRIKPLYTKECFESAMIYLRELITRDIIANDIVLEYVKQMLDKNRREFVIKNNVEYVGINLEFEELIHAEIACAFWNAALIDIKCEKPYLQPVFIEMRIVLIATLETYNENERIE